MRKKGKTLHYLRLSQHGSGTPFGGLWRYEKLLKPLKNPEHANTQYELTCFMRCMLLAFVRLTKGIDRLMNIY